MSMRNLNLKGGASSGNAYLIRSTEWMRMWVPNLRLLVAVMVLMVVPLIMAQRGHLPPPGGTKTPTPPLNQPGMDPTIVLVPSASEEPAALRQTRVARNAMRQRQLVEKTQQLQKLTDELRTEIDAAEKDTLSADAIKKSEQIEKLAKSIRSLVVTPL